MMNLKAFEGSGRGLLSTDLTFVKGRKTTKIINNDIHCAGQDSYGAPLEY